MGFFSYISGWTRLAERYPAARQPAGPTYARQTVQVGPVRFRRCVTVGIDVEGLFLWARPILSRYPAVLIPWSEITSIRTSIVYWQRAFQMSIGSPEVGTVCVLKGLFEQIVPYLDSTLVQHVYAQRAQE